MKQSWFLLGALLFVFIASCQAEEPEATIIPTIASPSLQAESVSLITLARNPAGFEGRHIQLTGLYMPLPLLVCNVEAHRSPATWTLRGDGVEVQVSGSDGALRQLATAGMSLVVEGRWREWQGPVGCGRRAPEEQIWYLEVDRIVSPNPLVSQELAEQSIFLESPTPPTLPVSVTPQPEMATIAPTATPEQTPTDSASTLPSPYPGPAETLPATATSTPQVGSTSTPLPGSSSTATATLTSTPEMTATATTAPGDGGVIAYEDLVKQRIGGGSSHLWEFVGAVGDTVTVSVAASTNLDILLEVIDPAGQTIAAQDEGSAGQSETVSEIILARAGVYQIRVTAADTTSGDYALVLQNSESEPFIVFRATLDYGDEEFGNLREGTDHLWNFQGTSGDTITIRIIENEDGDMVLYLLGPDSVQLESVDENGEAEGEELVGFVLPETGFYSIGVGEASFAAASYTITLDRE